MLVPVDTQMYMVEDAYCRLTTGEIPSAIIDMAASEIRSCLMDAEIVVAYFRCLVCVDRSNDDFVVRERRGKPWQLQVDRGDVGGRMGRKWKCGERGTGMRQFKQAIGLRLLLGAASPAANWNFPRLSRAPFPRKAPTARIVGNRG
jgi:hypothetical protein